MDEVLIGITLIASALCIVGGSFLLIRERRSLVQIFGSTLLFFLGLGNAFVPFIATSANDSNADLLTHLATTIFAISLATALFVMLLFAYEFELISSPRRKRHFLISYAVVTVAISIFAWAISNSEFSNGEYWFNYSTIMMWLATAVFALPCTVAIDLLAYRFSPHVKQITGVASVALCIILAFDIVFQIVVSESDSWIWMDVALITPPIVIASLFMMRRIGIVTPVAEPLSLGSKSKYKLLEGRVYVVEERQSHFSFTLFSEILRSRCHDCANDESFACESLDCSKCTLPCPCKGCDLYEGRTRGLVVTRRHPTEVRMEYLIQTTPVIWLSTIPGKDNMDPSKLGLLTDMIVDFLEKSENGVVLVEGMEYLVTSNDFQKVLRAIDRWSEVVMSRSSRLVMSLDPRAFDPKELALIERNREIVKPEDKSTVDRILVAATE